MRRSAYMTLVSLALLLGGGAAAAPTEESWKWKQGLPAGATVEIRNVNGAIEAAAGGSEVEVVAVKKVKEGNPADLKIEVVRSGNGVTICAVYPANDGEPANECRSGGGRMRIRKGYEASVAFTIKVPASLRLKADTVNGAIKTAALGGPADLNTVNGSIHVDSASEVRAKTVNGSVSAKMDRTDWKGELELTTVNGSVKVELPASANTEVKGNTVNGSIESDFGLPVEGKWGPKRVTGTIGSGGRLLNVNSVNGSLQLRKRS